MQVLELISPSQFYIHILTEELLKLGPLQQQMNAHYNKMTPKKGFK